MDDEVGERCVGDFTVCLFDLHGDGEVRRDGEDGEDEDEDLHDGWWMCQLSNINSGFSTNIYHPHFSFTKSLLY